MRYVSAQQHPASSQAAGPTLRHRPSQRGSPWRAYTALGLVWLLGLCAPGMVAADSHHRQTPLLAYYYIWFDERSWERAKTDYSILGRYSSDDADVMREHVRAAKQAGIDGFIVSWKSTEKLDRRLEQLIGVASEANFKLAIIYQGLDFERRPLPIERIEHDLGYFLDRYASNDVFDLFGEPLVIWSGTWEFATTDIAWVTEMYRERLHLLASEKNASGYRRVAPHVDGNAYYWSSVDPNTFPGYQQKLDDMAALVHEHGGLWIAPAAPGFDARKIGGTRVVERRMGETLRQQLDAALRSAPDAIGLISWNEFSENTQIEPSTGYGTQALETVAELRGTEYRDGAVASMYDFDSSAPGTTEVRPYTLFMLGSLGIVVLASLTIVIGRDRRVWRG